MEISLNIYSIRWQWAGNEGIKIIYATDEETARAKLWQLIRLDFKEKPGSKDRVYRYKILKTEKYER